MREYPILYSDVSCYYRKKKLSSGLRQVLNNPACSDMRTRDLCFRAKKTTKQNNSINFHLKITMFYGREKLNYWPGSINLLKI